MEELDVIVPNVSVQSQSQHFVKCVEFKARKSRKMYHA